MAHIFKSVKILKIFEISQQYHDVKNKSQNYKNLKIYLSQDFDKFTMLFTDRVVFLFLFKKNGDIEWNECLYSKNKEAVTLTRKIFEFYKEKSSKI